MVFKSDVICGHSFEVNFLSDIQMTVSLSQMKLASSLTKECNSLFDLPIPVTSSKPEVVFPYPNISQNSCPIEPKLKECSVEMIRDSGFEDLKSSVSYKTKVRNMRLFC